MVVSFDIFPPTERYDFGFSESEPYSFGFELLDYETVNFFDALGSIILIFILIVARLILQPLFVGAVTLICGNKRSWCCRKHCTLRLHMVTNIMTRFVLEIYLELVIASLLGITLKDSILAEEMNSMDKAAYYAAYTTLGIWIGFVAFVAFLTLIGARDLVKIRRDQLREFDTQAKKQFYED